MHTRKSKLGAASALTLAAVLFAPNQVIAAEYWLRAAATTVDMPNPNGGPLIAVPMWGYATCTPGFADCTAAITVPGPALTVPEGDATLTVHLRNELTTVPTSLVINGLYKAMAPVWTDGSSGPRADLTQRVRSFDAEAAASGGTQDYTWANVKPGTYLYQSGTQAQVQVQMGLYGAVTKNAVDAVGTTTRAQAYAGAAFAYDNQATLLYSEIDPVLHAAVADGSYGGSGPTSTLNYTPRYFLVNGQPFPYGTPTIAPVGNPGTTLLRILNAGLTTHVPMIQGIYWTVIAEDGKPYPYSRSQYTALLPAAKTVDVLLTPDSGGGTYSVLDRRLGLSNAGVSDGGMLTRLQYSATGVVGGGAGSGNTAPTAGDDTYSSVVGVTLNVGAPEGVLGNDSDADNLPLPIKAVAATGTTSGGGIYTLNTNGSFTYTPLAGYMGPTDTFTYQVTDGSALSSAAMVTINLTVPAAPALTMVDTFDRADSLSLGASWSQQVATGAPGPDVGITGNSAVANTTALGGLAIWNATTFGAKQGAGFSSATPLANSALVLKATGGTAIAPANYVRVRCEGGELVIATNMGGSNISVFVKQAAFAAPGCTGNGSLSAVVDAKGLVTAFLNGTYAGGVQLPDVGVWKGGGRIGIQLQTPGATIPDFSGGDVP